MFLIMNRLDGNESYPIATASNQTDVDALCALLTECIRIKKSMEPQLRQWKDDARQLFNTDGDIPEDTDRMVFIAQQHQARKTHFEERVRTLQDPWLELVILDSVREFDVYTVPHYTQKTS